MTNAVLMTLVLATVLAALSSGTALGQALSRSPLHTPYAQRPDSPPSIEERMGNPDTLAGTPTPPGTMTGYQLVQFAAAARAYDIPDLRAVSLPPGFRELRIARSLYSSVGGYPSPMLRLVEGPDGIQGELFLLYRRGPGPEPQHPDERCVLDGRFRVFVRPWTTRIVDWTSMAATLTNLGAWSITGRCEPPVRRVIRPDGTLGAFVGGIRGHQPNLMIQRLAADRLDSFRCYDPGSATQIGQLARAILDAVTEVTNNVPYP